MKKEKNELKNYISSEQSEFVAIYGRRRVGKTFLVKELLEGKFTFRVTGKEKANLTDQLLNFAYAQEDFFNDDRRPKSWTEAFRMLSVLRKRSNTFKARASTMRGQRLSIAIWQSVE